jgi:hypothetical protein
MDVKVKKFVVIPRDASGVDRWRALRIRRQPI